MLNPDRIVIILLAVFIGSILGCSRNNEKTEQKQLFDFNWKFYQGDISSASAVDFNDHNWRDIDLPHDWAIDERLARMNSMEITDAYVPAVGWYRKKFSIPTDWQRKRVSVYFEGIEMDPEVYVNGNSLGLQNNGSNSFTCDITPFLNYKGKNIIAVRVNSTGHTESTVKKGVGIYRHAWLILTDTIYFSH